jgi:hypothetical protein
MATEAEVITAAQHLSTTKDETSLLVLVGMLDQAIKEKPELADQAEVPLVYDSTHMGLLDPILAVGRKILKKWNKAVHGLVCGNGAEDSKERQNIVSAFRAGEAAVIGAVAAALMGLWVPAPIAAALAPIIVKKFIWPAKDELCAAWGEAIAAAE